MVADTQDRLRLMVIIGSTRPGRVGPAVANWFARRVEEDGRFELDLVDLAELALPFMDEPNHPRLQKYTHPHTIAWAARVEAADAVVFVTPEYNHGFPAPLKNAIDYLQIEWGHKAAGFISYGGVSAGTRAVQMLKQVVVALRMMPATAAVPIPFIARKIDADGQFQADQPLEDSVAAMLPEMERIARALRTLRVSAS